MKDTLHLGEAEAAPGRSRSNPLKIQSSFSGATAKLVSAHYSHHFLFDLPCVLASMDPLGRVVIVPFVASGFSIGLAI